MEYKKKSTNPAKQIELDNQADQIVRDNISWMLTLASKIMNDESMAQDMVQEAFLNAFKSLDRFEERASLKTWLYRITVNTCLGKLRQLKRLSEQSIDKLLPEFDQYHCRIEPSWASLASVDHILENAELSEFVNEKIHQLPDNYRIVLLLRDIEGYSIKEVSGLLEMTESNVKVRLHRARSALKKLLEPVLRGEISL